MAALTLGYVGVLGYFGVMTMIGGGVVAAALGVACIAMAALGAWAVAAEVVFGFRATQLTNRLAREEGLPTDRLPVTESGRRDREAARAALDLLKATPEIGDGEWQAHLRFALLADASGDRRAARRATIAALRAARRSDR